MVIQDAEIMGVIGKVCREKNMKVRMSGGIAASAAVCLGPLEYNISGAVLKTAFDDTAMNEIFKSLYEVMAEWSQEFKTLLIEKVRKILTDAGIYVLDALGNLSQAVVKALWAKIEQAIIDFCRETTGIEVISQQSSTNEHCGSIHIRKRIFRATHEQQVLSSLCETHDTCPFRFHEWD
ncbi:hypothetical protein CDAR_397451 [Caerostris darwini]|uniref:Uncharacterized protein n=1 Tax=Caerostris darwini TaxID=1538125 RepID=A0AAV4PFR1_9ARAC|nr:hypothetical protein CDAR_397451 [Caerostris darwini]